MWQPPIYGSHPYMATILIRQVREHPWVARALALKRHVSSRKGWSVIVVSEVDMRRAIISGHVANFKKTKKGTLLKTTPQSEADAYALLLQNGSSNLVQRLPRLLKQNAAMREKEVVIEIEVKGRPSAAGAPRSDA